ncbi:UDP-N-acetylglucosamine acyltransferase [Bdellovibrio sp. HCB209]|uniref:UDP-N-acetylglucosamine acyltransferase n=1 Tax=Bdellovibrio sp. HCB209 TaxID=3394354 RepID=UPI0039B471F0
MSISNLRNLKHANYIHPTAVIDDSVVLGEGNYIGPYCIIGKDVQIGNNNRLEAHCSIGTPPEHRDFWTGSYKSVVIGNDCIIREYATVNSGTTTNTTIGNGVSLLHACYVAHDCIVGNNVTISGNSAMGGHCVILDGANIGLNVSIHQYSVIGHYAMLGMGTVITKKSKIEPIKTYVGNPARYLKPNQYAVTKNKLSVQDIERFNNEYQLAYEKMRK